MLTRVYRWLSLALGGTIVMGALLICPESAHAE